MWVTAALLSPQVRMMPRRTAATSQGPCVATAPSATYVPSPPRSPWNWPQCLGLPGEGGRALSKERAGQFQVKKDTAGPFRGQTGGEEPMEEAGAMVQEGAGEA